MTDRDDYPTDDELHQIERAEPATALDLARAIWHWPDFGVSEVLTAGEASVVRAEPGQRYVRFATGGWSGNESIISALEANLMTRAICWRLSARGGLHVFEYPQ